MSDDSRDEDDKVGYCKPPKHTQFKAGQSGNPKGRPKGVRNFATDVREAHLMPVRVMHGKRARTVSSRLAVLLRLREKALNGDARAMERFLDYQRFYAEPTINSAAPDSPEDQAILAAHEARILAGASKSSKPRRALKRRKK